MTSTAARAPTTEVVDLAAEVLEVTTEGDRHWASVRFTGTLREGGGAPLRRSTKSGTCRSPSTASPAGSSPGSSNTPERRGAVASRFDPEAIPAALANRVLAREPWARSSLAAHAGRMFTVAVGPIATTMRIDASGRDRAGAFFRRRA